MDVCLLAQFVYNSASHLVCYTSFPWNTGVPGRPEITGFSKPAMEGDIVTLMCTTSGSKPAANIRWFRNDEEVQGKHAVWISLRAASWKHHYCQPSCCIPWCSYSCIVPLPGGWGGFTGAMIRLAGSQHCCCCAWRPSKCCWTEA